MRDQSGVFAVSHDPGDTRTPTFARADQIRYEFLMVAFLEGKIDWIGAPEAFGVSSKHVADFAAEWYIASRCDAAMARA